LTLIFIVNCFSILIFNILYFQVVYINIYNLILTASKTFNFFFLFCTISYQINEFFYFGCSWSQRLSTRLVFIISFKCLHKIPLFNNICVHLSRSVWYFFVFSTMCCHSCGDEVSTRAVADLSWNIHEMHLKKKLN